MKPILRYATAGSLALATLSPASAADVDLGRYPSVIVCEMGDLMLLGYLHSVRADGSALYFSADARQGMRLNAEGVLVPGETARGTGSCAGKSLPELEAEGRAFFPLRAR